ncbi:OmpA family protein [Mucilaginibacter limnophilus]|uniref:OmpA family protein n=1 Tax=Mucilaginibacter limnophilus TaxID=1932778 RepID=A0A3S2Y4H5_9SPHI|nr:OmpA family protein [Mucilaginibacter limnophilus]RVU01812.1 OmpA family protein [Mucilaginibacter limnophilus]
MNYSTLKKTAALSFASLMVAGAAMAQVDSTSTDSTVTSTETTTARVFGGSGQYNKWSFGINGGITSTSMLTGGIISGPTDYPGEPIISWGTGASLRYQFSHIFGIIADVNYGRVSGDRDYSQKKNDAGLADPANQGYDKFETEYWQGTLSAYVNIGSVDFMHRKNSLNFYVKGGAGLAWYNPVTWRNGGPDGTGSTEFDPKGTHGLDRNNTYAKGWVVPVGVGAKFRLSNAVALNVGYTMTFIDEDNFDGFAKNYPGSLDSYSYAYAGLEFTFGSSSKPNMDWVNPVAMLYDELYDPALRQEVEALKGRVSAVETAVSDLKKDSDGDGVSDQFDKCPNTPAGTVVDGAGCAIVFPAAASADSAGAYSNIQFEFDSSVLRTSAYPALDATSADLRSSGATVTIKGYASSEGTPAYNMSLSKDRANSVKTYLVNSGVPASKLKVKAYGETNPIADNSTEEGRILNRRVEFSK